MKRLIRKLLNLVLFLLGFGIMFGLGAAISLYRFEPDLVYSYVGLVNLKTVQGSISENRSLQDRVRYYAELHSVPPALMRAVIQIESGSDEQNRAIAIADKWQRSGSSYKGTAERWKYAAYGLCQLVPAYTMELCGYSAPEQIWGSEAIDAHLDCCAKRLRSDYLQSRGKTESERWRMALGKYYGIRDARYESAVFSSLADFSLEIGR